MDNNRTNFRANPSWAAGDRHISAGGTTRPTYNVRVIESVDGIVWPAEGEVAIKLENDGQKAQSCHA